MAAVIVYVKRDDISYIIDPNGTKENVDYPETAGEPEIVDGVFDTQAGNQDENELYGDSDLQPVAEIADAAELPGEITNDQPQFNIATVTYVKYIHT